MIKQSEVKKSEKKEEAMGELLGESSLVFPSTLYITHSDAELWGEESLFYVASNNHWIYI